MASRDKILRFYKGTEGEEVSIRLADLAEQVQKSQKFRISPFLDPYGQEIAETVAANYDGIHVDFSGGYPGAERQQAMLIHDNFGGTPSFDIKAVRAVWNADYYRITHRDVLGALIGLGLERGSIGDILLSSGEAKILVGNKAEELILAECVKIGAASVQCSEDDISNIQPREERTKEISATVASLRVDAIAAAGFGFSRSRAAADIAAEKVKLNWQTVKNSSQQVKEGDILSMRGRGRLEIAEVRGRTKKGRTGVLLKRFF